MACLIVAFQGEEYRKIKVPKSIEALQHDTKTLNDVRSGGFDIVGFCQTQAEFDLMVWRHRIKQNTQRVRQGQTPTMPELTVNEKLARQAVLMKKTRDHSFQLWDFISVRAFEEMQKSLPEDCWSACYRAATEEELEQVLEKISPVLIQPTFPNVAGLIFLNLRLQMTDD